MQQLSQIVQIRQHSDDEQNEQLRQSIQLQSSTQARSDNGTTVLVENSLHANTEESYGIVINVPVPWYTVCPGHSTTIRHLL